MVDVCVVRGGDVEVEEKGRCEAGLEERKIGSRLREHEGREVGVRVAETWGGGEKAYKSCEPCYCFIGRRGKEDCRRSGGRGRG